MQDEVEGRSGTNDSMETGGGNGDHLRHEETHTNKRQHAQASRDKLRQAATIGCQWKQAESKPKLAKTSRDKLRQAR